MVISDEMEETMYYEPFQFFIECESVFNCLSLCSLHINHNVTENKFMSAEC